MKREPWIDKERVPRGFGKRGGIFCPVCRQEARRVLQSDVEGKYMFIHDGRGFPCVKRIEAEGTLPPEIAEVAGEFGHGPLGD